MTAARTLAKRVQSAMILWHYMQVLSVVFLVQIRQDVPGREWAHHF